MQELLRGGEQASGSCQSGEDDESKCAASRAPDRITMERVTFGTQLSSQNIASNLELTPKGDFCAHHFLSTQYRPGAKQPKKSTGKCADGIVSFN